MSLPFDIVVDLAGLDTSVPHFQSGKYPFRVKSAEVVYKKDDETKKNLKVQFTNLQEEQAYEGGTMRPGMVVSKFFPLQQSDDPKAPNYLVDIARFIDAAFKTGQDDRPPLSAETIAQLPGKDLELAVRTDKNKDTDEIQTSVVGFKPLAE